MHSEELDKIAPALVALQADLKPVEKSETNPFYKSKYVALPGVREALQPLLEKHELSLTSFPIILDGKNGLKFYLIHESGQFISGEWQLNPVKDDPQAVGSAITYLRRYGDMAITSLVADEDDDANSASNLGTAKTYAGNNPPSEKQLSLIRDLCKKMGYPEGDIEARVANLRTSKEASSAIETLNDLLKDKDIF